MSNPEHSQVFRSDQAPEMAFEDTSEPIPSHPRVGPRIDQVAERAAAHDGEIVSRHYEDAEGPETARTRSVQEGLSDLRSTHDAEGLSDLRSLHDAEGLSDQRSTHDSDGLSDLRSTHDAEGLSDLRSAHDADGLSDLRSTHDADGLSDLRSTHDAEGLSDLRSAHDADGLSDLRQLHQRPAEGPGLATGSLNAPLFPFGDYTPSTPATVQPQLEIPVEEAEDTAAAIAEAEAAQRERELIAKAKDDAVPWALSLHLEERIAKLGAMNSNTKEQLDGLESYIQRLAKRIGK